MTREEAIKILTEQYWFTESEIGTKEMEFYIQGLINKADMFDLDRYAWLNTLFGYDIGYENAMEINTWLWELPNELETMEITHNDKKIIKRAVKELKLKISFDKWVIEEPKVFCYF